MAIKQDALVKLAKEFSSVLEKPVTRSIKNRIAYIVSHGASYASNGYAVRTQGVAKALNEHGYETLCMVRPGRPWELDKDTTIGAEEIVDGVRYIHSGNDKAFISAKAEAHLKQSAEYFKELFYVYRPEYVIAASDFKIGLPALIAAKQLGIPFFNEVRGFWEMSRIAREPEYERTNSYKRQIERDTFVAQQANAVFTLSETMRTELAKRGVDKQKVHLLPNGVSKLPELKGVNTPLRDSLGIQSDEQVVGFIGSINAYEGLDTLISACKQLIDKGNKIKLLIVGDSQPLNSVMGDRYSNNISSNLPWLIQVGRVPHEKVGDYYSVVDTIVIPRKRLRVCDIVPPLKIAEALSYGKQVIVSNVKAMQTYADSHEGVRSFSSEDAGHLADLIKKVSKSHSQVQKDRLLLTKHCLAILNLLKSDSNVCKVNDRSGVKEEVKKIKDVKNEGRLTEALELSKDLCRTTSGDDALTVYIECLYANQKYSEVLGLLKDKKELKRNTRTIKKKSESYLKIYQLYHDYCKVSPKIEKNIKSNKSVCFLHSSLPYFSGGYATRAHGLISAINGHGLDTRAYTRPNFPYDVKKDIEEVKKEIAIDNVAYKKTSCDSVRLKDEATYMLDCIDVFDEVIQKENPAYVHGRSTYQIALPALIAAKKNNLPFVYEVSGLWEVVHESRATAPQRKHETERMRYLEAMTAKKADIVFTLTGAMKDELILRGVDESKISILPNCTNPDKFKPKSKDKDLLEKLGIEESESIIGYIGSFQDYEGLDDLIDACEILHQKNPSLKFRLLLVGDGPYFKNITEKIAKSIVKERIILTGRVPHAHAADYYSIVDIAPFPRKSWPVCEMVSPMKPLEALAMEKTVLVSSVSALSEMVVNNETGFIFEKGSTVDLAERLAYLINNPSVREKVGTRAREWVYKNRTWTQISKIFSSSVNTLHTVTTQTK